MWVVNWFKAYAVEIKNFAEFIDVLERFPFLQEAIVVERDFPLFQTYLLNFDRSFGQLKQLSEVLGAGKVVDLLCYDKATFQACVQSIGGFAEFFSQATFLQAKLYIKMPIFKFFDQSINCFADFMAVLIYGIKVKGCAHLCRHPFCSTALMPERFKKLVTQVEELQSVLKVLDTKESVAEMLYTRWTSRCEIRR